MTMTTTTMTRMTKYEQSIDQRTLRTTLEIPPSVFSADKLYDHILHCLKEKEMTCNQEDGYIDHIYHITNMENRALLDSGYCKVDVWYEAACFKPSIGKEVETTVEMVFPHGIFSSLYVLRFLVPLKSLEQEYEYVDHHGYRHLRTGEWIRVGSVITIRVTNMKYDNGHFSCIAELVHDHDHDHE